MSLATEDQEWVDRIQAGETDAYRVLVERHERAVFQFAVGMLGDREVASDVAQEAFFAAFVNLKKYDPSRATFRTWLLTITRNRTINQLKRRRPKRLEDPSALVGRRPTDSVDQRELHQQLDNALAALPDRQRAAFVLAEMEQLAYAEIAKIEKTNVGTVKSRVHRAKQKLQALLEPVFRESR